MTHKEQKARREAFEYIDARLSLLPEHREDELMTDLSVPEIIEWLEDAFTNPPKDIIKTLEGVA